MTELGLPRAVRIASVVAFALTLAAQLVAFRAELREVAEQTFHPAHTDATQYVERAEGILRGDWSLTLGTGYRTPAYPLLIALFLGCGAGLVGLRVVQCALVSLIPAILGIAAFRLSARRDAALLAVLAGALFAPIYWFSTWIFAEAASGAVGGLLLLAIVSEGRASGRPLRLDAAAGALVGIATLLKPNQLLLAVPVLVGIALTSSRSRRSRLSGALVVLGMVAAMVAPWSLAVSRENERPVLLSTADGINLWIGVGGALSEEASLFGRTAKRLSLYSQREDAALQARARGERDWSRRSEIFRRAAMARIEARPADVALLGLSKVLHVAGFSLRGIPDCLYALLTLVSAVAAVVLVRSRDPESTRFVAVWVAATLVTALQAFVFLPNYRFRAVFYDPSTIVLVSLAASRVLSTLRSARSSVGAVEATHG